MQQKNAPKVSVCVITYNHASCIRQCLQSIVDQKTDFAFEVIVGDDASTDGAQEILSEYSTKYPGLVIPVLHDKNTGGTPNYFSVHEKASGEYVAHLDGDDAMLPGKLQKQADFLDQHPECAIVAHDLQIQMSDTGHVIADHFCDIAIPAISDIDFLLMNRCFFGHSSKMYRRSVVLTRAATRPTVDFFLHVEHASKGKIGYIDEVLGEYRKSSGSLSDPTGPSNKHQIDAYYDAFNRAAELGVDPSVISKGRLLFNYSIAYWFLLADDRAGFEKFIDLDRVSYAHATFKHRLFFWLRSCPVVIVAIIKAKTIAYEIVDQVRKWAGIR